MSERLSPLELRFLRLCAGEDPNPPATETWAYVRQLLSHIDALNEEIAEYVNAENPARPHNQTREP